MCEYFYSPQHHGCISSSNHVPTEVACSLASTDCKDLEPPEGRCAWSIICPIEQHVFDRRGLRMPACAKYSFASEGCTRIVETPRTDKD